MHNQVPSSKEVSSDSESPPKRIEMDFKQYELDKKLSSSFDSSDQKSKKNIINILEVSSSSHQSSKKLGDMKEDDQSEKEDSMEDPFRLSI